MRRFAAACALLGALAAGCGESPEAPSEEAAPGAGMALMAHGDHSPRYGGYVFMHGDLHFEVVLGADGEHAIYFSDATRSELPAAVAEGVRITVRRGPAGAEGEEDLEPLRTRIDDYGEAWVASGRPVEAGEEAAAIVWFSFEGAPYEIEVPFIMEPPAVDPHTGLPLPAAGDPPPASPP